MISHGDGLRYLREHMDVSHETSERLVLYVDLLLKWQGRVSLVSRGTLSGIWERHILDSAQVFGHVSGEGTRVMDIGSGAGFPGLVLAILRSGFYGEGCAAVTLVESDHRKCAFLSAVGRACGLDIVVREGRVETLAPSYPDVITARGLASVEKLLALTRAQHHGDLRCVFLKGENVDEELTSLADYPNIKIDKTPSITSDKGTVLTLSSLGS